jgi:hypothetical protein
VFIRVSARVCISIYICTVFLKKSDTCAMFLKNNNQMLHLASLQVLVLNCRE